MNKNLYSNKEFTDIIDRINNEILRRGGFKWWDPLCTPTIGQDKSSPVVIPTNEGIEVNDKTYTINNPSEGSIEETKNINYPAHGQNPGGVEPYRNYIGPNTSAAALNTDELKNLIVGLSKIEDINLFYGRDEVNFTAFRDPNGIEEVVKRAEESKLNELLHESDISPTKNDPNGGIKDRINPNYPVNNHPVTYPMENDKYVMPSGEYDGEELLKAEGLGVNNFYDDYGANPGDSDFHPFNRYRSPIVNRDWNNQDNQRVINKIKVRPGGLSSERFGRNPRNPEIGDPYPSRPVYGGKQGSCIGACTGMCFMTCDNECGESCSSTCWNRCGNACTSSCGCSCGDNCSSQCFNTCKTKCENKTGYSCVKAGAKTIRIWTSGGKNGIPAENHISYETYSCNGCSFSCQFYPNKKTECWDAGCMGKCFISCNTACSDSCHGGCINNHEENDDKGYHIGKGRGCMDGCTINCSGICSGICAGFCTQTCWHACKSTCSDDCSYECFTECGAGCANGCRDGCKGCVGECSTECGTSAESRVCAGCGAQGGCTSQCQFDCNTNCMGFGCRSLCGIDNAGSCESNCRINCTATSCTAMCSEACSDKCTTCVNTCGFNCGTCSSKCSTSCGAICNINCSKECSNNCSDNCVHSCSEECGGCSNLCYSCTGICISICSVKCENGCSNCANQCGWWCDSSCNQECFSSCDIHCINSCVGSCSTLLQSDTTLTKGPERKPISIGYIYPNPKNRWEERESFKLTRDIPPYVEPPKEVKEYLITIQFDENNNFEILRPEGLEIDIRATTETGGVFQIDSETGEITIDEEMLEASVSQNNPSLDGEQSVFFVIFKYNENIPYTDDDITAILPFGFMRIIPYCHTKDKDTIVIITKVNPEFFPGEDEYDNWHEDFHDKYQ